MYFFSCAPYISFKCTVNTKLIIKATQKQANNDWVTKGVTRKRFKCPLLPLKMIFHLSKTCLSKLFHLIFFFVSLYFVAVVVLFVRTENVSFLSQTHTSIRQLTIDYSDVAWSYGIVRQQLCMRMSCCERWTKNTSFETWRRKRKSEKFLHCNTN